MKKAKKENEKVYQIKVLRTPVGYSVVAGSKDEAIKIVMNDYYDPAQEISAMWIGVGKEKERVDLNKFN